MFRNSVRGRCQSLLRLVLCVPLAAACNSDPAPTAPLPSAPSPSPAPTPESKQYRVSGVVMDAADAAPIANATVMLQLNPDQGDLTTQTDANGGYAFTFQASQPYRPRTSGAPGDLLGLLIVRDGAYWGDIRRGHWTIVQLLPWGTPDVVHNVRLRPVRTLIAGQSMRLSVESDSSVAWDKEWDPWFFPQFDTLAEEFVISAQRDGELTVDVRPEAGASPPWLTCPYVGCFDWRVPGTATIRAEARWSPFYFSVQIPRASAPQRYEIQTSLR